MCAIVLHVSASLVESKRAFFHFSLFLHAKHHSHIAQNCEPSTYISVEFFAAQYNSCKMRHLEGQTRQTGSIEG
jgi:hypothetical protein